MKQVFSLLIHNNLLINSIDTCWTFSTSDVLLDSSKSVGFPDGSAVKNPPAMQEMKETWVRPLSQEDPLEEGMVTHSSILAWIIPWTEDPSGVQSIELQKVRHNWAHTGRVIKMLIGPCVLVAQSCPTLCSPMDCSPPRLLCPWDSPSKNTGAGSHSPLQGSSWPRDWIQVSCMQTLYHLSHQGSPWNPLSQIQIQWGEITKKIHHCKNRLLYLNSSLREQGLEGSRHQTEKVRCVLECKEDTESLRGLPRGNLEGKEIRWCWSPQVKTEVIVMQTGSPKCQFGTKEIPVKVKVAQLCLTHGILQARILNWVAFPFCRGSSQPRDQTQVFCIKVGFFTSWATGEVTQTRISSSKGKWLSLECQIRKLRCLDV